MGKQHTQKIDRKHTMWHARIQRFVRKPICVSRSVLMHGLVLGLFINRYEFGYAVEKLYQLHYNITPSDGRTTMIAQFIRACRWSKLT
jgi:hypothetical protein